MNAACCILLAALSVFDYPARQADHERFRRDFAAALRSSDAPGMLKASKKGVALLPDDPTWAYNLACSLSRTGAKKAALDALEKAIELGFRDGAAIAADGDFAELAGDRRFKELVEEAKRLAGQPLLTGPNAAVPAIGIAGGPVFAGEHNISWDLEAGCYRVLMNLEGATREECGANAGDLYLNRDDGHSMLDVSQFPGVTSVMFDAATKERMNTLDLPNALFPYPVFGNCSRALVAGPLWRSHPRALATTAAAAIPQMQRFYLSNQIWVFPAVNDCPPAGTNGDVFASVTPYCIATAGRSWSDQYCLKAALEISRTLPPETKKAAVSRGLLAPLVQSILRKSIKGVASEEDYFTAKAHPTAFAVGSLDMEKLKALAAAAAPGSIPPLAPVKGVAIGKTSAPPPAPEITYFSPFAWAFVLRADDKLRTFAIAAAEAPGVEYAFAVVHDPGGAAKLETIAPNAAKATIDKSKMSPVKRVDVAVFARRKGTKETPWGAPSFVSFAVVDPSAPYSDPALANPEPAAKLGEEAGKGK